MSVTFLVQLPENLAKEASELGLLSSEHIVRLLSADIQAQLQAMAADRQVQDEIEHIEAEFALTELDGLEE